MLNNNKIIIDNYGTSGLIFYPNFSEFNLIREFMCLVKNFAPYNLKRNPDYYSINGSTYCFSISPTTCKERSYKNRTKEHLFKKMIFDAFVAEAWSKYFKSGKAGSYYCEKEECYIGCMEYSSKRPSLISERKRLYKKTKKFLEEQIYSNTVNFKKNA